MSKPSDGENEDDIPALFATIHFRSPERPDGYTDDDIRELNELANAKRKLKEKPGSETSDED